MKQNPESNQHQIKKQDYRNQNPPIGTVIGGMNKTQEEKDKEEAEKIVSMIKGGIK